jgi:Tfp pilus assembly protein PilN
MRPINLLPRQARGVAATRRKAVLGVFLGLLYVAALAGLTFVWNGRVESAEDRLAEQQAVNQALRAEVAALSAADELRVEYDENALLTSAILSEDVAWGRLLNDFGRLIPERVWLDNFVGTVSTSEVPGVVGRVTVSGSGFDFTDVAAWLRSLDEARFPGIAGTWVSNATATQGFDTGGGTIVTFSSSAGLTDAAVSNRLQERIPEVPG